MRSIENLEARRMFAAGGLVGSFGSGGAVSGAGGSNMAAGPNGTIVYYQDDFVSGNGRPPKLERILANGSPDPSFGSNGKATLPVIDVSEASADAYTLDTLSVLGDGTTTVAMTRYDGTGNASVVVARLLPNGKAAQSFATAGALTLSDNVTDVSVLADGRFTVLRQTRDDNYNLTAVTTTTYLANGTVDTSVGNAGVTDGSIAGRFTSDGFGILTRHVADGAVDTTFGDGGMIDLRVAFGFVADTFGFPDTFTSPTELADGSVLVSLISGAGTADPYGTLGPNGMCKLTPSGQVDRSYGTNGLSPATLRGKSIQTFTDGTFLTYTLSTASAAGSPNRDSVSYAMDRFDANGAPDTTFGDAGHVEQVIPGLTVPERASTSLDGSILTSDGRLVIGGMSSYVATSASDTPTTYFLFAVHPDAENTPQVLATDFGATGVLPATGGALAVTADGGFFSYDDAAHVRDPLAGRLVHRLASGKLDASFGAGGSVALPALPTGATSHALVGLSVGPDGKPFASLITYTGSTTVGVAVLRWNANGSLDATFGTNGSVALPVESGSAFELTDGRFVVARFDGGGTLTRYRSNGTVDDTFGTDGTVPWTSGVPFAEVGVGGLLSRDGDGVSLYKTTASGTPDVSFGKAGKTDLAADLTDVANSAGISITAATLAADGSILLSVYSAVAAGGTLGVGASVTGVIHVSATGQTDTTFGTNGVLPDSGKVAALSDGRFVTFSTTGTGVSAPIEYVANVYTARGQLDPSFAPGGTWAFQLPGVAADTYAGVTQATVASDGRVLVNAATTTGNAVFAVRTDAGPATAVTTTGAVPAVTASTVPASVLVGAGAAGNVRLSLTNSTGVTSSGVTTVRVYASSVDSASADRTLVGTFRRRWTFAPGQARAITVRAKLPKTLAAGVYALTVESTDPSGSTATVDAPAVAVAAPRIALDLGIRATTASPIAPGGTLLATIALTNNGTAAVSGTGAAVLTWVTQDLTSTATPPTAVTIRTRLPQVRPGRTALVRLRFVLPTAAIEAVPFLPTVTLTLTGTTVTATGADPIVIGG